MMRSLVRGMIVAAALVWPQLALAQSYPNKPIKLIVPFPAGGPADTIARVLTEKMAPLLGQPIIIESRAGAGGVTGIAAVAKAEPEARHRPFGPVRSRSRRCFPRRCRTTCTRT